VCFAQGAAPECVEMFRRVVEITANNHGPDALQLADYRNNYAAALRSTGRWDEARRQAEWALRIRRRRDGEEHPGVGASLAILADIARARGDLDEALERAIQARDNAERTRGPTHDDTIRRFGQLAAMYEAKDQLDAALSARTTALERAMSAGKSSDIQREAFDSLLELLSRTARRPTAGQRQLLDAALARVDEDGARAERLAQLP
jgi:tetratricopeptide (TPR) repeat protein